MEWVVEFLMQLFCFLCIKGVFVFQEKVQFFLEVQVVFDFYVQQGEQLGLLQFFFIFVSFWELVEMYLQQLIEVLQGWFVFFLVEKVVGQQCLSFWEVGVFGVDLYYGFFCLLILAVEEILLFGVEYLLFGFCIFYDCVQ